MTVAENRHRGWRIRIQIRELWSFMRRPKNQGLMMRQKIPPDLEATPTETNLQLMMIDPTIADSEVNEGNEISSGAANQGIHLPSAPLNYGINDSPIGT